jgi:hypothetical protein
MSALKILTLSIVVISLLQIQQGLGDLQQEEDFLYDTFDPDFMWGDWQIIS